jgi:hypothetical protein
MSNDELPDAKARHKKFRAAARASWNQSHASPSVAATALPAAYMLSSAAIQQDSNKVPDLLQTVEAAVQHGELAAYAEDATTGTFAVLSADAAALANGKTTDGRRVCFTREDWGSWTDRALSPKPQASAAVAKPYWSIAETCVWAATRDLYAVADVSGRPEGVDFIEPEGLPAAWKAFRQLPALCGDDKLTMHGVAYGDGNHEPIPATAWPGLEITHSQALGRFVAASPFNPGARWWTRLTICSADAQRIWPPREQTERPADDVTVKASMQAEILKRRAAGERTKQPDIVLATTTEFHGRLTERRARQLYKELPKELKGRRGPKGPRIS